MGETDRDCEGDRDREMDRSKRAREFALDLSRDRDLDADLRLVDDIHASAEGAARAVAWNYQKYIHIGQFHNKKVTPFTK